jgi:hypothetical protein
MPSRPSSLRTLYLYRVEANVESEGMVTNAVPNTRASNNQKRKRKIWLLRLFSRRNTSSPNTSSCNTSSSPSNNEEIWVRPAELTTFLEEERAQKTLIEYEAKHGSTLEREARAAEYRLDPEDFWIYRCNAARNAMSATAANWSRDSGRFGSPEHKTWQMVYASYHEILAEGRETIVDRSADRTEEWDSFRGVLSEVLGSGTWSLVKDIGTGIRVRCLWKDVSKMQCAMPEDMSAI